MDQMRGSRSSQQFGTLFIDHEAHEVCISGHPIHLTLSEFTLLTTLAEYPRRAFSNEYLTQILTRSDWVEGSHGLQAIVSRLRRKLGESGRNPKLVVSVHGYGYRFEPERTENSGSAVAETVSAAQTTHVSDAAFAMVDLDRRIAWASTSSEQILEWRADDLQGKILYDLIHADDLHYALAFRGSLDEGHPVTMTLRLRTASGDYQRLEAVTRPIFSPVGVLTSFLCEFRRAPNDGVPALAPLQAIRLPMQVLQIKDGSDSPGAGVPDASGV